MKSSKRNNQKNINSKSPSPINRSRSRNKDEANYHNHNYNHSGKNGLKEEGKLYLSNIPINFNQQKIKEEFEKYGCIKDYSLRKRTDVPNPYYYGYITFLHKTDSEKAMENISKIFNWTVMPFNRDSKDKNLNKEKNLNNVSEINDTKGHEEGDKQIIAAAKVLISTQRENSEIIRTNGNEFLIYLVGYEEKAVLIYINKLMKEFKNLPYGYGASIGYHMITSDSVSIDDAINEALKKMRENKED